MRHHRDTQLRPSRETQLKVGNITESRILPRWLTTDCRFVARVGDGLGDEEVLGQVAAKLPQAAGVVDDFAPEQRRHARVARHAEEIRHQIHARLISAEVDFLEGRGETLAIASEWHLVDERDVVLHVEHHVDQRVFLHSNAAVGDHHELVLGVCVRRVHVVYLWIDAHVGAAQVEMSIDVRIFVHELLHHRHRGILLVFNAEQKLERRVLHGEEGLEVL